MRLVHWLRSLKSRTAAGPRQARPATRPRPRLEALEDRCLMTAGALDPTFGGGTGYATTALSSGTNTSDTARQVLLQPSGNIVVAGATSVPVTTTTKHGTTTSNLPVFGAVTYNPDGSLDAAFGSGGIVRQPFAGMSQGILSDAALEPTGAPGDSKILLAGQDMVLAQGGMALMRLNPNGTLDTTFGSGGQVITPFQTSGSLAIGNYSGESANAVVVTSGGQILVIGHDNAQNNVETELLARYNPDGSLDPTFGIGGKATTVFTAPANVTNFHAFAGWMALQADGKFVAVGSQSWNTATSGVREGMVLRYNADGSLDPTFGNGGIVTTVIPFGSTLTSYRGVAIYPNAGAANDGKIVVAANVLTAPSAGYQEATVVRYNPNGSLDGTFGNGAGYAIITNTHLLGNQTAQAVALESDGKPIVVGDSSLAGARVARLNLDGSLDATFGSGGWATLGVANFGFDAVAIQPNGNIVGAGYAPSSSGHTSFVVARFLPSEPQIGSFTASPNAVPAGGSVTLTVSNIIDGNAGATVTQVAIYRDSNGDGILEPGIDALLGYATRNPDGTWSLTISTPGWVPGSYKLFAQAQDSDGVFGDPFALTLNLL